MMGIERRRQARVANAPRYPVEKQWTMSASLSKASNLRENAIA